MVQFFQYMILVKISLPGMKYRLKAKAKYPISCPNIRLFLQCRHAYRWHAEHRLLAS
jgi:hypothetical protein